MIIHTDACIKNETHLAISTEEVKQFAYDGVLTNPSWKQNVNLTAHRPVNWSKLDSKQLAGQWPFHFSNWTIQFCYSRSWLLAPLVWSPSKLIWQLHSSMFTHSMCVIRICLSKEDYFTFYKLTNRSQMDLTFVNFLRNKMTVTSLYDSSFSDKYIIPFSLGRWWGGGEDII